MEQWTSAVFLEDDSMLQTCRACIGKCPLTELVVESLMVTHSQW